MLGYHNHDFEFNRYEGKYLHDYIFEAVPADRIEPELDTCWVHYAGIRPEQKIRQFSGRVHLVHLKDFVCKKLGGGPVYELIDANGKSMKGSREDNGFEFCPLGQGLYTVREVPPTIKSSAFWIREMDSSTTLSGSPS